MNNENKDIFKIFKENDKKLIFSIFIHSYETKSFKVDYSRKINYFISFYSYILKYFFNSSIFLNIFKFNKFNTFFPILYTYNEYLIEEDTINEKIDILDLLVAWFLKDSKLFINVFNNFFNYTHFKKHPIILRNLKISLLRLFSIYKNKFFYGISIVIRGKFGLGGSVKKRKVFFYSGFNLSKSNLFNQAVFYKKPI